MPEYYEQPASFFCDECELCEEGQDCKCSTPEHDLEECLFCGKACHCDSDYEAWRDAND